MKTLLNRWLMIFSLIWLIVFICTKQGLYFYWPIQFYLIDLLAVPIIAQLCLWWMRFILQKPDHQLSKWNILIIIIALIIVFEIYLPMKNPRYVGDFYDGVMYVLGGFFFLSMMNE
ncbi:hypothetical protein I5M32_06030 [Pedobacter sp. SD-b]|uniref:Magnesium citrate secondary transporter n=1 Tax=Pedobacter segetis TaxID=2793069 RepID=A0ABS1BI05_9SPHI|nr:hypothetical protein [Pedobacter segetis]MBK0382516.1 hypothetical protein [Pedobacter segetis]